MPTATDHAGFRWMEHRDYPFCASFDETPFGPEKAWTSEDFRQFNTDAFSAGIVATENGKIIAFVLYRIDVRKQSLTLARFCVKANRRRRGVGAALMAHLKEQCHIAGAKCRTMVSELDLGAQLFLKHCGFLCVGKLNDGAPDKDHDLYLFEWKHDHERPE